MTHRAESILATVATTLTGLTTTASRVQRARAWPIPELPALTILKGRDELLDDDDYVLDDVLRRLEVEIRAQARSVGVLETTLNTIAAEVYAALVADRTLGLGYVHDVELVADEAPELEAEQDQPVGRMAMTYTVIYEHSNASTES